MDVASLAKEIKALLKGSDRIEIDINDAKIAPLLPELNKARVRLELSRLDYAVDFPKGNSTLVIRLITAKQKTSSGAVENSDRKAKTPTPSPTLKRHQHSYVAPAIAKDMISILTDDASHSMWLTGPTQCGKDVLVHYCGRELGRPVVQINCRGDMGSEVFFGEKTIVVDPVTKQNVISFQKGLVEQAFTTGLDEQGNEVGEPAILFITEAASMPTQVAIGLNRMLESDSTRRTLVIDQDGGRVVRSHSKLRIVFAANTVGRGSTGTASAAHTAQMDALDISLLARIAVYFKMGYDRKVEEHILAEKIGDDRVSSIVLKFRDAVRDLIKQGKLDTPFSTAHIVHIADMYRIFGDIGKAIYYVAFESLPSDEKSKYNELLQAIMGIDVLNTMTASGVDYV
jgi:MoxR-like ATPase